MTSMSEGNRRCGKHSSDYQEAHHLCAGDLEGKKSACCGDSGGPLVAYTPEPVLVGSTSWGYGCGLKDYPGMFARTSKYAAWIAETMNPTPRAISIGDVSVQEGDANGPRWAYFNVVLDRPATQPISVEYRTVAGTATAGKDFVADSGTLEMYPGDTETVIAIEIKSDKTKESNENFTIVLENPSGTTIARGVGTGTILNDDPNTKLGLGIDDVKVGEGDIAYNDLIDWIFGTGQDRNVAAFTVSPNKAPGKTVTVNYATTVSSAGAEDFDATSRQLTFTAKQTWQFLLVPFQADGTVEIDETFTVTFSGASGAGVILTRAVGTGTILNDD